MKRINKKLITILLSIVLFVSIVSATALAVTTVASGELDNGITWSISSDGVLTISGEGEVPFNVKPWSEYAEDITSVVVEDGITELSGYAFWKLSFVKSVSLPDSLTLIGGSTFGYCTSLKSIIIPDSVTEIEGNAFYECSSLENVKLPDGPANSIFIDGGTFSGCSSLKTIYIPASVRGIEDGTSDKSIHAFSRCYNLVKIEIDPENQNYSSDENGVIYEKYENESVLVYIPANFSGNYTVPDNITDLSIAGGAFCNCRNCESITISAGVTNLAGLGKVDYSSYYHSSLKDISGLKTIYVDEANQYYSGDANGVLFDKNKTVLYYASADLSGDYVIPAGVTKIEERAFRNCTSLKSVTIPDTVTTIGYGTFSECSSLETIPESVTEIGGYAFEKCTSLKSVRFEGDAPQVGFNVFDDGINVYYPEGNDTWNSAEVRKNFGENITWVAYTPNKTVTGDVNGDGEITNTDIVMMARYIVGMDTNDDIKKYGDMNGDGVITNVDVVSVARIIVGLE